MVGTRRLLYLLLFYLFMSCSQTSLLTKGEISEGYIQLFDGKTLNGWVGNKTDYTVQNGIIVITPEGGGQGNLYTQGEYSNFVFRFKFRLTPGANNGLGIHAPLEGDAAYQGKEIQILDNTAAKYASLKNYQYHGSVYGVAPAKKGYLKPVGEWNEEEVYIKDEFIRVTLNNTVILEGEFLQPGKNIDEKSHPGLSKKTGHIGFLGHGDEVHFKDIRLKVLD